MGDGQSTKMTCMRLDERPDPAARPAGTHDVTVLLGAWVNAEPDTQSVARMILRNDGSECVLRAFGGMEDGAPARDWGEVGVAIFSASSGGAQAKGGTAVYDFGFLETTLTFFLKNEILILDTFNVFKAGSARADYFTREFFYRRLRHD